MRCKQLVWYGLWRSVFVLNALWLLFDAVIVIAGGKTNANRIWQRPKTVTKQICNHILLAILRLPSFTSCLINYNAWDWLVLAESNLFIALRLRELVFLPSIGQILLLPSNRKHRTFVSCQMNGQVVQRTIILSNQHTQLLSVCSVRGIYLPIALELGVLRHIPNVWQHEALYEFSLVVHRMCSGGSLTAVWCGFQIWFGPNAKYESLTHHSFWANASA